MLKEGIKRAYKALDEYEIFAQAWEENEGEEVARLIKEDIISCVTSGQLPCQFASAPAESTMKKEVKCWTWNFTFVLSYRATYKQYSAFR